MILSIFIIPAILASLIYYFFFENDGYRASHQKKSLINAAIQIGFGLLLILIIGLISYYGRVSDVQILNGYVVNKDHQHVSCSHSYQCNCRQVRSCSYDGKKTNCTYSTVCDTCYEHLYDIDWNVYSTIGSFVIERIDRQGLREPSRWSIVRIGDPVSKTDSYTNYIKGSPASLFRHQGELEKYKDILPEYPDQIYDYYRIKRFVSVGVPIINIQKWNEGLSIINSELGAKKQANMLVVFTNQPNDFFYALEEKWIGGKKNDIVLVIGTSSEKTKAQWVQVMSLTKDKVLEVKLRDAVMDLPSLFPEDVLKTLHDNVDKFYSRKRMHDFEYLKASIVPSFWEILIGLILSIIGSVVIFTIIYNAEMDG